MRTGGLVGLDAVVRAAAALVAGVLAMGLGGCGGPSYTVRVGLEEAWVSSGRVPTLEVDLVGASASEVALLNQKDLREYFQAGDPMRTGYPKKTFSFTQSNTEDNVLERSDPVWKAWNEKKAEQMFVLVNLPGIPQTSPGDLDPRRLVLPLDRARWSTNEIEIEVRRSGLEVLTDQVEVIAGQ